MTPERWQQIRSVYEEAEILSGPQRAEYLDRVCDGDAELRLEVESLLDAAARATGGFLNQPAAELIPRAAAEALVERVGQRVGPYRITAEIGRGGMGEVYRAVRVDGQFNQEVAIKLVRVGMGSSFAVQRFLQERQILASLNHPQIARLLDGGTTADGVPYLAMELIEGERVDVFCESQKLSVNDRLKLFLQICDAVQYAHQRLIVHRDIKPNNILVTADGVPKLLDFGIAKMLDPALHEETTMASPMTPEYASPEQIKGEPITTTTDVYSLGVVLYRLLTGRNPYGAVRRTPHEWSRAIADTHPQRPSSIVLSPSPPEDASSSSRPGTITSLREPTPARLQRRLAGDIDNILLKALRKEPDRRYGSVEQFAEDISRHLNGLPVSAAKGSWSYFARKFVARHRAALAATAAVILTLTIGIIATERQARIAKAERAKAQKRFEDVRQFSDSLIFDIHDALEEIPGTTSARSLLLDRAVKYLDSVSKDAEGDSELQRELASAYQRLARVQGDGTVSNTGQISASEASTRKSIALFEAVARANPENVTDQLNLAVAHRRKGFDDIYYPDGRPEIEQALAITEKLIRRDSKDIKVEFERSAELQGLGMLYDISGDRARAVESLGEALALSNEVARQDPSYHRVNESVAKMTVEYGYELAYTGELTRAREQLEAGVADFQTLAGKGARSDTVRDLAQSRLRLAKVEMIQNDLAAADRNLSLAQQGIGPLARADPGNILYKMDRLSLDFEQARLLVLKGKFAEGEAGIAQSIENFRKSGSEEDTGPGDVVLYTWLGEAQLGRKDWAKALESFQRAAKSAESGVQYDDVETGVVTVYVRVGDILMLLNRWKEAEQAYTTASQKADRLGHGRRDLPALWAFAASQGGLASLWWKTGDANQTPADRVNLRDRACKAFNQSLQIRAQTPATARFSPDDYPVVEPIAAPELRKGCGASISKTAP